MRIENEQRMMGNSRLESLGSSSSFFVDILTNNDRAAT
jgi:hypothetical protein